jgi:hypothetical protein
VHALLGLYLLDRHRAGDDLQHITSLLSTDTSTDAPDAWNDVRLGESEAVAQENVEQIVRHLLLQGGEGRSSEGSAHVLLLLACHPGFFNHSARR